MKRTLYPGLLVSLFCLTAGVLTAQQDQSTWSGYTISEYNIIHQRNPARQAELRKQEAWQDFRAENGAWYVEFDENSGLPLRASGPAFAVDGGSPEDKATRVLGETLRGFELPMSNLELVSSRTHGKFHYVDFQQRYSGLPVLDTRATLRFTLDGRLVMFGLNLHPQMVAEATPALSPEAAAAASGAGLPTAITTATVNPELAFLPVLGAGGVEYRLVYQVELHTEPLNGIPGYFVALVDARTGEVLRRQSRVHDCAHALAADAEVEGTITDNPLVATEVRGLPYVRVNVAGTNYYTDELGMLSIPTVVAPESATVYLEGLFARIYVGASSTALTSFVTTINPGTNVISFDAAATTRQLSAYYHTNIVHDFMKSFFPTFTVLDFPFTVRVDRTDGTCNAFYDGSSINFYAAGGGCPATSLFSDVVYHEYGHGLNYDVYDFFGDFSGMGNGAMQEGYADIWGLSISGDPILGAGFSGPGTDVRRYDIDPKVFPEDLVGQVHADGEIIAGAWWDLSEEFGSLSDMTDLWINTFPATIDGPDGDEGSIYSDVLLEALLQDDDDADLSNGTPRDIAIITAFAIHGITLLANAELDHTPGIAAAEAPVAISVGLDVDFPAYLGDVTLRWRRQNEPVWNTVLLGEASAGEYAVDLPAQPAGTILEYFFEVSDIFGAKALTKPFESDLTADPNLPYFTLVGFALQEREDFDNFAGDWEIDPNGTDNAATGQWEINVPQASSVGAGFVQPGIDNTTDNFLNFCLVTGANGYSASSSVNFDIDGGETSVKSPDFDATAYDDPVLSFYRWFSNDRGLNPGNDPFEVFIANDGATWVPVRNTKRADASWRQDVIRISDYVGATPTVSLLFIASDRLVPSLPSDGGSLVEALVDDLFLYGIGDPVIDTTSGINDPLAAGFVSVFPNPTGGAFQVSLPNGLSVQAVEVVNNVGQLLWQNNPSPGSSTLQVPDLGLAPGVYTVKVLSGQTWSAQRVVVTR
ncbi:MAG: T9SS type A sorting domain-containing protein [Bacteroidetes bacterium]|nr:T9SS type A sorting domain-containing protein [Bacteroidota bacterium]